MQKLLIAVGVVLVLLVGAVVAAPADPLNTLRGILGGGGRN